MKTYTDSECLGNFYVWNRINVNGILLIGYLTNNTNN